LLARIRANRHVASLLAAGGVALVIPALAWAGSGGAGPGPTAGDNPGVHAGNVPVSATSGGLTLMANASAFVRSGLSVTGSVPTSDAGAAVEIAQLGPTPGSSWSPVAVVHAASDGSFAAAWRTRAAGPLTIRAVLQGNQASSAAASAPSVSVTLYRRSIATLYGPGFYGQRTACGVILRRRTIGMANRTLKCGTEVQVYYSGRVMTVPVIDRGPYAHNANWDLTMATGRALGMQGTSVIGAASMPSTPSTPSTPSSPSSPSTPSPTTSSAGPPAAQ
jgi:rare lipoprotein A